MRLATPTLCYTQHPFFLRGRVYYETERFVAALSTSGSGDANWISVDVAGQTFDARRMLLFRADDRMTVSAGEDGAQLLPLGNAPLENAVG